MRFLVVLTGFLMAAADSIPGVSGGTIAFIIGLYEELINSIKNLTNKEKRFDPTGKVHRYEDLLTLVVNFQISFNTDLHLFS